MKLRVVSLLCLLSFFSLVAVDGDLDPTFNGDGMLVSAAGSFVSDQSNGLIINYDAVGVAVGTSMSQGKQGMRFFSFDANGIIDSSTSFVNLTSFDTLTGGAVQPDKKVVAVGYSEQMQDMGSTFSFVVARFGQDGQLDVTFNAGGPTPGVQIVDFFGATNARAFAVAFTRDGRIVAVGQAQDTASISSEVFYAVAVLNTDGSLDTTFAGSGRKVFGPSEIAMNDASVARAVAIQSIGADDYIILAGYGQQAEKRFQVARIELDGTLDATFGTAGVTQVIFAADTDEQANGVDVYPDGQIIAIGTSGTAATSQQVIATRLTMNGTLDPTFGTAGRVIYSYTPSALLTGNAVVMQNNLRPIIVGGYDNEDDLQTFFVLRLQADGTPDNTFGSDATNPGSVLTSFGDNSVSVATSVALQQDGKVVVSGTVNLDGEMINRAGFARYENDNALQEIFVFPTIDTPMNLGNCAMNPPTFAGDAQNPSNVAVYINGALSGRTITTDDQSRWTFTPLAPLPSGKVTVQTVAEYKSGNMHAITSPFCCGIDLGPLGCIGQAIREKYCPSCVDVPICPSKKNAANNCALESACRLAA